MDSKEWLPEEIKVTRFGLLILPTPQMAKHIYFAESALDAMSFYQLNANKIKLEESVFCSVGGYISVNQIKTLYCDTHKLKYIPVLIMI